MNSRTPLYIIGGLVVIAIAAIVVYVASQNTSAPAVNPNGDAGQTGKNTGGAAIDAVQADKVEVKNYAYGPIAITVKIGTKVTWTNRDDVGHTVTTESGAPAKIDSGLFGKGESFSYTFEKAGTYAYFCEPHPYMKGTVIVTE